MKILYTDKEIVVAVKPYGVLSEDGGEGSMPALLAPQFGKVFPVHRLDRVVGGVMVYARTKSAAATLSRAVSERKLKKEYIAVLEGAPSAPCGELRDLLFKDARQNKSFVVDTPRRGAREAVLTYRTLDTVQVEGKTLTRVSILLDTGRSHQIRVQFASRGTPLVGDGKYGSRIKAGAPALFAAGLAFPHPKTGKMLSFCTPTSTDFPWSLFALQKYEIEHKYLIAMPDRALLDALSPCRKMSITQTYLLAPAGETHRVRRVCENENVTFYETRKRRVSALRAVEEERPLTESEYQDLLTLQDPTRQPIEKLRYRVPYGGHTVEIDVYPFWQDRAIAEVEVESEEESVTLPSFIKVLQEVTVDKRYKNVNMARSVPNDDISRLL
ncbi:MAG: hypothetical protein IKA46_06500 [Clostridia bacterium]|nr:hypothetical protein [Clostridia bacterium]